jgi:hypothetical protein
MKKTFTIPVSWTMIADMKIKAETLEEAISIAEGDPGLPTNGQYCDSSFEVNTELVYELNRNV